MNLNRIINENHEYWAQRASTYSDVNKTELAGESREMWKSVLQSSIARQFPGRQSASLRVLDIGTGPGFFSIILTELGYRVTAVDYSPAMLSEARQNAGKLAERIDFREMNAEELNFGDGTFDVIATRNLTWNLPRPAQAYREWHRVLRPGGLLLNFDSNWYTYLFDEDARAGYEADRVNSEAQGLADQNVGDNFDLMEDIAREMPLSGLARPGWDTEVLSRLGFKVTVCEDIWKRVWTRQEQVNFASTPMFLIQAVK